MAAMRRLAPHRNRVIVRGEVRLGLPTRAQGRVPGALPPMSVLSASLSVECQHAPWGQTALGSDTCEGAGLLGLGTIDGMLVWNKEHRLVLLLGLEAVQGTWPRPRGSQI